MKKYKFILTIIIVGMFSICFVSCKKDIDFNKKYDQQKLVVNCIFDITNSPNIYLTESRDPTVPSTYFQSYSKAEISIFSGENKISDFSYNENSLNYSSSEDMHFKTGETYSIIVTTPKYGKTSASFSFPTKILIDSIELKKENVNVEDEGVDKYLVAYIHFKDMEGEKNFYQIDGYYERNANAMSNIYLNQDSNYVMPRPTWSFLDSYFQVDDVLKNNGALDSYDNIHQIFNDDIFDGKGYTLKYLISYGDNIDSSMSVVVHIFLKSLSPDLYYYYKSLDIYNYNDGDFTVEPTNIYNNIENGLGIVGTYQVDNKSATYIEK